MTGSLDSSFPTRERTPKRQRAKQIDGLLSALPAELFKSNVPELTSHEVGLAHRASRFVVSFAVRAVERGRRRGAPNVVVKFAHGNGGHKTLLLPPYVLLHICAVVDQMRAAGYRFDDEGVWICGGATKGGSNGV